MSASHCVELHVIAPFDPHFLEYPPNSNTTGLLLHQNIAHCSYQRVEEEDSLQVGKRKWNVLKNGPSLERDLPESTPEAEIPYSRDEQVHDFVALSDALYTLYNVHEEVVSDNS